MMKFFVYELKKNVWTLVVLTALATILYVVVQSASSVFGITIQGAIYVETPQIGVVYGELGVLCILVPVLMYSFKMNKRSVDEFYSLPIKREKIYLAKTLAGLILVMVPYAVAYWSGFLSVALRENYYHLGYYAACCSGFVFTGSIPLRLPAPIASRTELFSSSPICLSAGSLQAFCPKFSPKRRLLPKILLPIAVCGISAQISPS